MDHVKEMRAMQEARDRAMAWKWVETLLVARHYMDMTIPDFYTTLPHYLDFIALHQSFQQLGVLSALVCKLWKAHQITGLDYRQFCTHVVGREIPFLPANRFADFFADPRSLVRVPALAVSDLSEQEDKEAIQTAILKASQRFVLAYLLCHRINPSPAVWELVRLPRVTEHVELHPIQE